MRNRLTDRDIAILASIEAAHYLTIEHLQWLHWPTVRAQFRAAREAGAQSGYGPSKSYERARFLANSGLITPIIRAANRGETTFARLRNAFCITERVQAIARTVAGLNREPSPAYRFTTEERLHPSTIRRRWQMIAGVSWPDRSARRGAQATPQVVLEDAPPLWIRQAAEPPMGEHGHAR